LRLSRLLPALAVALAAGAALPAGAQPAGAPCTVTGAADPAIGIGNGTGLLRGGPVTTTDASAVTLVCAIQVGGTGVHSDPDDAAVSAHGTPATVPPTLAAFGGTGTVYVCTSVTTDDGTTQFLDAASGTWGTDPSSASCADGGYVDAPEPPEAPVVYGAVAGMISVVRPAAGPPTVQAIGYFSDPDLFTCTQSAFDPLLPFSVTCVPQPSAPVTFYCAVLHANAFSGSPAAHLRTEMDCDGDSVPEARTRTVAGNGDFDLVWATSNVAVTAFTCTFDDGAGHALAPDTTGGCGDPGAAHL
jgi:hypothetical protein